MFNKRAKRRIRLAITAGAVAIGGFGLTAEPASADGLCATATVYVAGSGTPVGGCLVDPGWIDNCAGAWHVVAGTGARVDFCVPTPV